MLTKDEGSDLRSLIAAVKRSTLAREQAMQTAEQAENKLENFIWNLEHKLEPGQKPA